MNHQLISGLLEKERGTACTPVTVAGALSEDTSVSDSASGFEYDSCQEAEIEKHQVYVGIRL